MEIRARHGTAALLAALTLHVAVAAVWLWESPSSGAQSAGMGGIAVSLGPAGGAPGAAAPVTPDVSEAQSAEATRTSAPPPAAEPIRPPETAVARRPAAAKPPELPQETPAESVPVETVAAAEPTPPREQQPPAPPRPATTPQPERQPAQEPPPVAEAEPAEELQVAKAISGAGGRSGTKDRADTGSGDARAGGGLPGEKADYMALLQAWLERHKEYPRRAQLRRQQGTAMLYFVMDRDGKVLEYQLRQSSGYQLLDREVVAMIERAQPLPEMPEGMRLARLKLVVPVQFQLR